MNGLHSRRLWIRAAARVREQYQSQATAFPIVKSPPVDHWTRIMRLSRLLTKAQQHHYPAAFERCLEQYKDNVSRLIHELNMYHRELVALKRPKGLPSLSELTAELCALPDEFDETRIEWSEQEIVVRTPEVVLSQVNLGEFEIRLRWSEIGAPQPYRVISLSQTGSDDIHHPHVQGDMLCEGEGKILLSYTLAEGRLGDFFLLVQQILRTYNPASAYVPLENWWNSSCADCDDSMSEEESRPCSICEHQICEYCRRNCTTCGDHLCSSCADTCETCHNTFCRDCLSECDSCSDCFCRSCLSDQTCSSCLEESMENEDATPENPAPDTTPVAAFPAETSEAAQNTSATVQSVCLGQVDLPA
ncbi:hypothetical protein HG66A1_31990 [Gimesia chilikensis]|uniref:Uncharacterized protein n=1 Tax=Gimesia chilikensis TaxID=2605989 RepID=A0A517PPW4_9PLAN|nr:hypothetical protein HG66A1_31990 [Gimesia chilikensis]